MEKQTWRLIHPDKTESLMNYNPEESQKGMIKIEDEIRFLEHIKQMLISQDMIRKSDSRPTIRDIQNRIQELKQSLKELGEK